MWLYGEFQTPGTVLVRISDAVSFHPLRTACERSALKSSSKESVSVEMNYHSSQLTDVVLFLGSKNKGTQVKVNIKLIK